jgi:hypothetical protein
MVDAGRLHSDRADSDPADSDPAGWDPGGRSPRWRLGMIVGGSLLVGFGAALWLWPQLLIWLLAGACALLGAILILSGICARGR